jgi:hypothetical protein
MTAMLLTLRNPTLMGTMAITLLLRITTMEEFLNLRKDTLLLN